MLLRLADVRGAVSSAYLFQITNDAVILCIPRTGSVHLRPMPFKESRRSNDLLACFAIRVTDSITVNNRFFSCGGGAQTVAWRAVVGSKHDGDDVC